MKFKITIEDDGDSQDRHYDEMAIEELLAYITKMSYEQAQKDLENEIMWPDDMAIFFKRKKGAIYNWVKRGELPRPTSIGGNICWTKKYLLEWLRERMCEVNAPIEELRNYDPRKIW